MFYSETLLSKTGPLARVWLSSNLERKLSKTHILQSDIQSSVGAIVDQGQAPMALRLSGQLLLGVVRIYSRKARYLLEDCNEALMKIKMAFRLTNNNDLPNLPAPVGSLTLPDLLTEADLFANLDISSLLSQTLPVEIDTNNTSQDIGMDWTSSLNPESNTQSRLEPEVRPQFEDATGLELDLGEDLPVGGNETSLSIEFGREAPAERPVGEDLYSDDNKLLDGDDLELDLGEDVPMPDEVMADGPGLAPQTEHDNIDNFLGQDDDLVLGGDETFELRPVEEEETRPARESLSPLSDADPEVIRDLDRTFGEPEEVEEEVVAARQPQRSKKRKVLVPDAETVLHSNLIKEQQNDRSKILKPASFLPKDPILLTLMNMQKRGDFVSNIMGEGRSKTWAPELRGLLSLEAIRSAGELKRKRDSGVGDMSGDEQGEKTPRLEIDDEDVIPMDEGIGLGGESTMEQTQYELPADERLERHVTSEAEGELPRHDQDDEDEGIGAGFDEFEDTTVPLVHPADNGPVSLGTKHAVHLLRDRFDGEGAEGSHSSPAKRSVLFQDLLPEGKTSREDATKMFFEVLVLATKDAVKVEQGDKSIGGPLRIRGKRGLWGSWAETEAGGEIAAEEVAALSAVAAS